VPLKKRDRALVPGFFRSERRSRPVFNTMNTNGTVLNLVQNIGCLHEVILYVVLSVSLFIAELW
jgi:hypothetical protein